MTRRAAMAALACAPLAAATDEVFEMLARLASALSASNARGVLREFDPAMPQYAEIERAVDGLLKPSEVLCSLEILENEGDSESRRVLVDWFFELRPRGDTGPSERRREAVRLQLRRPAKLKRWRIVSFEPLSILAPAS